MMRPYKKGDALNMTVREEDIMLPAEVVDSYFSTEAGIGYTFETANGIGAVVGLVPMWHGVGSVIAVVNDLMIGHSISFTEACVRLMDIYFTEFQIVRYQALINPKIERNVKWIHYLGFHRESVMQNAAPHGGDLEMYVKFATNADHVVGMEDANV